MNNKGFTLIELLMVLVLLSIITIITAPVVGNALNDSKERSYKILISNIKTAAQSYYEECSYNKEALDTNKYCIFNDNKLSVRLNELVNLGFLSGSNECGDNGNTCSKTIKSPKGEQADIGECMVEINKVVTNGKVTYTVSASNVDANCPTVQDFEEAD